MNNCKLLIIAALTGGRQAVEMMTTLGISHTWYEADFPEDAKALSLTLATLDKYGSFSNNGFKAVVESAGSDVAVDYHKIAFHDFDMSGFDWKTALVDIHKQYTVDEAVLNFANLAATAHNSMKKGDTDTAKAAVMSLLEAQQNIDALGGNSIHSNATDPSRFITVERPDLVVYTTGIPYLDDIVPITPKSVTTFIGGTGVGKSMTMTWILKHLAEKQHKPFMFSVEMPFDEVESRICSMVTGVYGHSVIMRTADESDIDHISAILPTWNKRNEYFVDDTQQINFSLLVNRICVEAAKGRRVFIIDYLDIVNYDLKDGYGKKKWELTAIMIKRLKLIAYILDLAIITAAQFNREGLKQSAKGGAPSIADIAGTSEILFTSSNVILINKQDDGEEGATLVIEVAKVRAASNNKSSKRRFEVGRSPHGVFHSIGDTDFDITGASYMEAAQQADNGIHDYDLTPF